MLVALFLGIFLAIGLKDGFAFMAVSIAISVFLMGWIVTASLLLASDD